MQRTGVWQTNRLGKLWRDPSPHFMEASNTSNERTSAKDTSPWLLVPTKQNQIYPCLCVLVCVCRSCSNRRGCGYQYCERQTNPLGHSGNQQPLLLRGRPCTGLHQMCHRKPYWQTLHICPQVSGSLGTRSCDRAPFASHVSGQTAEATKQEEYEVRTPCAKVG